MKKSFLALLISSALLLSACDEKEPKVAPAQPATEQATQAKTASGEKLNVEIITLFDKGDLDNVKFNPAEPFTLSVKTPQTGVQWLDNQLLIEAAKFMLAGNEEDKPFPFTADMPNLKQAIQDELAKTYQEYSKEILDSLEEMKQFEIEEGHATAENWQPSPMMTSQFFSLESNFAEQIRNIATFHFLYENYTGGAHGWHNGVTVNADLERKILIGVEELIGKEESKQTAMKNLLWESYKKYHIELAKLYTPEGEKVPTDAEILENLFIQQEDIFISSSFQFHKEGVLFSYPPYAIGSYAEGQIELLVEWKDIQPLLTKEYRDLAGYEFKAVPKE